MQMPYLCSVKTELHGVITHRMQDVDVRDPSKAYTETRATLVMLKMSEQ